jgi:hypothetical protein
MEGTAAGAAVDGARRCVDGIRDRHHRYHGGVAAAAAPAAAAAALARSDCPVSLPGAALMTATRMMPVRGMLRVAIVDRCGPRRCSCCGGWYQMPLEQSHRHW